MSTTPSPSTAASGMNGRTPRKCSQRTRGRCRPTPEPEDAGADAGWSESGARCASALVLQQAALHRRDETRPAILHELNECDVLVAYDPLDTGRSRHPGPEWQPADLWRSPEHYFPQSADAAQSHRREMSQRRRLEKQRAIQFLPLARKLARTARALTWSISPLTLPRCPSPLATVTNS